MIESVRDAFALNANSSCGAKTRSIENFSFFLTVPN